MSDIQSLRIKYKIDDVLRKIDTVKLREEILRAPEKHIYRISKLVKAYDPDLGATLQQHMGALISNPIITEDFVQLSIWCHTDSMLRQASKGQFSYELICSHTSKVHVLLCSMIAAKRGTDRKTVLVSQLQPNLPFHEELAGLIFKTQITNEQGDRLVKLLRDIDPLGLAFVQKLHSSHTLFTENEKSALFWAESRYLEFDYKISQYFAAFLYASDDTAARVPLGCMIDLYIIDSLTNAITPTVSSERRSTQLKVLEWTRTQYNLCNSVVTTLVREISEECIRDGTEVDPLPMLLTLECLWSQKVGKYQQ